MDAIQRYHELRNAHVDINKSIEAFAEEMRLQKLKEERKQNRRYWLATGLSIVALIISAIALWLQARG